jgi:hypothetical protein
VHGKTLRLAKVMDGLGPAVAHALTGFSAQHLFSSVPLACLSWMRLWACNSTAIAIVNLADVANRGTRTLLSYSTITGDGEREDLGGTGWTGG